MIKKIIIYGARFIYCFFKLLPTKNKITMISRQSNKKTIDFALLEDELRKSENKIKTVILCHKLEGGINANFKEKLKYALHCLSQMYHIATSKVVVLDSYCILISILKHKKNLKVIQMWHSMGTMKKFGYQILDKSEGSNKEVAKVMQMHKNYDYVFASSMAYAKQLEEGFNCGMDKIRIYSLPRVDLLTSIQYKKDVTRKIGEIYPNILKKQNIVYCPTFRKKEENLEKEIYKMIDKINFEKYNFIVKLHPLSKIKINDDRVIFDRDFSSMDMLFIANYVISDYSCIIYEAAILNIPLFFFAFDLEEYLNNRGLTIDYEMELPGVVSKEAYNIIDLIEDKKYDLNLILEFRKKYVTNIENCTRKIVKFIEKLINE